MSYKKIGDLIQLVDVRNKDLSITHLVGLTINKKFIPSVANTIGTDMSNYKIIRRNQFACSTMQVRRDKKMPVALLKEFDVAIISQAYPVFEVMDENEILPEYLMLWFSRSEFDREACFHAVGGVRGSLEWEDFCNMELPVPSIEKQREIVDQYQAVANTIKVNEQICEKLEATAQALYKQWFVDFEFPITKESHPELFCHSEPVEESTIKTYKSSGGAMVFNKELEKEIPEGWEVRNFGDFIDFINGYGFSSEDLIDNEIENSYAVFKMGNIKKGGGINLNSTKSWISKDKCNGLDKFILKQGDLLICMTDMKDNIGLLGNTALIPLEDIFIANQRCGLIRSLNIISPSSLYIITNEYNFLRDLRSRANRGVQVNLTTESILKSRISFNLNEFKKFNIVSDKFIKVILSKEIQNQKLTQLQALLLSRLATLEG